MEQGKKRSALIVTLLLAVVLVVAGYFGTKSFQKGNLTVSKPGLEQESDNSGTTQETTQTENIVLTITSPENGATVSDLTIIIEGKTTSYAEITIGDKDVKADSNGEFSASLGLDEGENTITVVANDSDGNYAEKEITIILNTE